MTTLYLPSNKRMSMSPLLHANVSPFTCPCLPFYMPMSPLLHAVVSPFTCQCLPFYMPMSPLLHAHVSPFTCQCLPFYMSMSLLLYVHVSPFTCPCLPFYMPMSLLLHVHVSPFTCRCLPFRRSMGAGATESDVDEMMTILDLQPSIGSGSGKGTDDSVSGGSTSARLDLDKDGSDSRDRQVTCSSEQFLRGMKSFLAKENESALDKFKAAARKVSNELGVIRVLRGAFASPSNTPRLSDTMAGGGVGTEADEYGSYGQQQQQMADGASVNNNGTPMNNGTPINSARTPINSARGPMSARLNMFMYARGAYQPQRSMLPNR